MGYSAG